MTHSSRPTLSAEDLYRFETIQSLSLAPDGQRLVYAVQRVERKSEKKFTNLWMVATTGGEAQRFTSGDQADNQPRWSPDGQRIAFLSKRSQDSQPQIYLIAANGGEAHRLTDLHGEFGPLEWSPDGRWLVCQFRKKDADALEREENEHKKELGVVSRRIRRVFYKLDDYGFLPHERWHIWIIDAHSGKGHQLTDGELYDETEPHYSPDGQRICFFSNRSADPDLDPDAIDLFVMDTAGGNLHRLDTPVGQKEAAAFSPDGQTIAYVGRAGRGNEWRNRHVWLVPVDSSSPAHCLTGDHDFDVNGWTINDLVGPPLPPLTWANDGQSLYFHIARHGSTTLHSMHLDGSHLRTVLGAPGYAGWYAFDHTQERLVWFQGQMNDPGQVYTRSLRSGEEHQLTRLNTWLADVELGQVEEVWFKGPAGNDLQGWILKPPGFDPQQRYPSILEIHGGPLVQYGNHFMHEFYYLAAHGYVVYFCNPRGGQGYGEAHAGAIHGAWGTADYDDLMAWSDYMEQQPYIDPQRMGVTGGSYGGYMTNWIIGHTQRFRAAATQRSVSNLISMWGSSDFNWTFQEIFGNQAPYESIEQLWRCSPVRYLGSASTPTLVLHNEQDLRCAIEQGEQVFVALKKLGVPTEMVIFPDEPHGLSRTGRTDRRIVRLEAIRDWFDRYLKG